MKRTYKPSIVILADEFVERDRHFRHSVNSIILELKRANPTLRVVDLPEGVLKQLSAYYEDARKDTGCNENNEYEQMLFDTFIAPFEKSVTKYVDFDVTGCSRDVNLHVMLAFAMRANMIFEGMGYGDVRWLLTPARTLGYTTRITYICAPPKLLRERIVARAQNVIDDTTDLVSKPVRIPPLHISKICDGIVMLQRALRSNIRGADAVEFYESRHDFTLSRLRDDVAFHDRLQEWIALRP